MAYAIRNLEPTAGAPGLRRRIVAIALAAMAFVPCTAGDAAADLRSDREKVWRNDYRPVPPPRVIDTFALIEVERPPPRDNSFWDADAEPMAQAIERELAAMFTRAATTKTGEERIVVRVTNLGWKSGGGFDRVVEPTLVLLDAEDGRELFRVTRRSPQNLRAYYLDVADLFGLFKSDIAEAFGRPALAALQGGAARRRGGAAVTEAGGRYAAERDLAFNVLDAVEFHPETQETVLVGHYEHRFAGRRTPYLQHLAALLENPAPEFSLDWTPDSERRVEAFLARMDSLEEMHGLDAVSGQWLSPDGLPTAQGRLMLPLFGVKPTRNGSAAGALGASVSPTADFEGVRIDRVAPGSAAERAGLKPGDVIHFFAERDMIYPTEFVRQVAFAGAGASVPVVGMRADGNPFRLQVTLDASPEDPWRHVTRHDIGAQMFRQIGMAKAARVLEALDVARRLVKTPAGPKTAFVMFDATESWGVYEAVMAAQARKEIALPEAQRRMQRAVVEGTEGAFRLPPGTLVAYFDGAMRRGANSSQAFSEAMLRLDEKIEPLLKDMLRTLLRRNDEIALPVTEADTRFGGRPEVVPRFDGVDPATPLARLLYEADYLGKSLIHRPELKNRIPGYKTEYAFEGAGGSAASTTHRMWISVDGVAASEEGKRLVLGEPRMRFNIREVRSGRDVPAQPGGYEELLTGLYTVLAEEFPALHELREAAKLARAAQWLRAKAPDLRLPEEGRSRWTAPRSASGLVYLIWSPNQVKVSMVAAGGVTLRVPPVGPGRPLVPLLPGPSASGGAMDLRDLGATVSWPEPYDDRILAGALARRTDARPSRPLGWTASVGTGRHSAIGVSAVPAACAAAEDAAPGRTLETAGGIALKLGAVENALGALGRPGPGRNVAVASLDTALRAASDGFVRDGVEAMTQDLLDALDAAERDTAGPTIDDLYRGAAAAKEAKSASAALSERLSRIRRSYEAAGVDDSVGRERAISELGALAKDVLAGGARRQAGSAATASRAERLKGIVEGVDPLLALGRASRALKAAPPPGEQDLARLRDALLAMQRRLSDELDGALAAPAFAAWLGESGSGVCGEKVRLAVTQPPRDGSGDSRAGRDRAAPDAAGKSAGHGNPVLGRGRSPRA